jgi:sulfite reductase (NADPH) flavoprotein alpha-component
VRLDYTVGDAFGSIRATIRRWPTPSSRRSMRRRISRSAAARLREVLIDGVSLSPAPDMLFQLFSYITGGERRKKAQALSRRGPGRRRRDARRARGRSRSFRRAARPEAFIEALDPLQPRLYSISSSPKVHKGRVSLTVDAVRYDVGKRKRWRRLDLPRRRVEPATSSASMCRRRMPSACRPIPSVPIIMIGPGTGVGSVPRVPARAHGDQGARAATGCSSATRSATSISSTRTSSPA